MLLSFRLCIEYRMSFMERRQKRKLFIILLLFFYRPEYRKPIKQYLRPCRAKCVNAALEHCIRCLGNLGRHLACKESVPDQCIQPELVTGQNSRQHIRSKLQICGSNRFMGILRILPPGIYIRFRRQIVLPVNTFNVRPYLLNHFIGNTGRVSTHVCNQSYMSVPRYFNPFIKHLGKSHRLFGAEIKTVDRILLHCGSCVRRFCLTLLFRFCDRRDFCRLF